MVWTVMVIGFVIGAAIWWRCAIGELENMPTDVPLPEKIVGLSWNFSLRMPNLMRLQREKFHENESEIR